MLTWGRESIKDHTTAVLELVKNSYDAGATIVVVGIRASGSATHNASITISDDGAGMSWIDVEEHWLRLGYSAKRKETFTRTGRRKTGEKGVGRISADRLGCVLEMRSQSDSQNTVGLAVDWRDFEHPGRDLESVSVQELSSSGFLVPRPSIWNEKQQTYDPPPAPIPNSSEKTGTELIIKELRQNWESRDVAELQRMLALLTSPFDTVKDFQIRIENDVAIEYNGVVPSPLWTHPAIEGEFELRSDGMVVGSVKHWRQDAGERVTTAVSIPFGQLVHPKPRGVSPSASINSVSCLGPLSVKLLFYPQRTDTSGTQSLQLSELREFLRMNAGIRVYRDGIRVPPYGDQGRPEGDWLGLGDRKARNPAGPGRPDFRVSPYQLAGAIFIGRDSNPELIDTSGREGLVSGAAFGMMRSFLLGCLNRLESQYHEDFLARTTEPEIQQLSPRGTVDELRIRLFDLASTIKRAEETLPGLGINRSQDVIEQLASTTLSLNNAEKAFEELITQSGVSRTLATIGIAAATFGHETQSGLDSVKAILGTVKILLNNEDPIDEVLSELDKAIREAEKVAAWGGFALGRVRRDRRVRRNTDIAALIEEILSEMKPALDASTIEIISKLSPVKARVFAMDIECVVINLLTNAYYFSMHSSNLRRIAIAVRSKEVLGRSGFELVVGDSGPGVEVGNRERIWNPLFTTKTNEEGKEVGTGLGLALVNAVVMDAKGMRTIDADPTLGGARFTIWLPEFGS